VVVHYGAMKKEKAENAKAVKVAGHTKIIIE